MAADDRHGAIVLAAGSSTCLGRAKQLLRRDGETLLHRAVRLAALTQPRRLLVVLGARDAEMRAAVADIDVDIIINPHWQTGLASSVQLAANAFAEQATPCLILGCDQPALEREHLRFLLRAAAQSPSACAAFAHDHQPGIPAVVSATVLAAARSISGDRGLGSVLRALPVGSLHLLDAPELCRDIDDADDLAAAIAAGLIDRDG